MNLVRWLFLLGGIFESSEICLCFLLIAFRVFLEVSSRDEVVIVRNNRLLWGLAFSIFVMLLTELLVGRSSFSIFLVEVLHDYFVVIKSVVHLKHLVHHPLIREGDVSEALGLVAAWFHDNICIHHFSELAEITLDAFVGGFGVQTANKHPPVAFALNLGLKLVLGNHLLDVDGAALEYVLGSRQNAGVGLVGGELEIAVPLAPSCLLVTSKFQTLDLSKLREVFNKLSRFASG